MFVQGVGQVKLVGQGPIRVQNGAQVGLTEAQGWQVATWVTQGVIAVQTMPQVLTVHATEAT
jgi:hypothetical protein